MPDRNFASDGIAVQDVRRTGIQEVHSQLECLVYDAYTLLVVRRVVSVHIERTHTASEQG